MKKAILFLVLCVSFSFCFSQKEKKSLINSNDTSVSIIKENFDTIFIPRGAAKEIKIFSSVDSKPDSSSVNSITIESIPVKPGPGAKPIEWINYLIGIFAVVVVVILKKWPSIKEAMLNSGVEILVRLASETSAFLSRIGIMCFSVASIVGVILTTGIVTNPWLKSIFDYIVVICLAVTSIVMLTKKDKQ